MTDVLTTKPRRQPVADIESYRATQKSHLPTPTQYGTGARAPNFYKWLDTGHHK